MALFGEYISNANAVYENIRLAQYPNELSIKEKLEALWEVYEPYADVNFMQQFTFDPQARFWEMYLTCQLLNQGKNISPRCELPLAVRNEGPDICIVEGNRKVWIEAITPTLGDSQNPDRVPKIAPFEETVTVLEVYHRQVELRITSALLEKKTVFQRYRDNGIVGAQDLCVVAVSGGRFSLQAVPESALKAVYPLGHKCMIINPETADLVDSGFQFSESIKRANKKPIPRYAFLAEPFSNISGLLWSRRSIGNFIGEENDFAFIHNAVAKMPFPQSWMPWEEEVVASITEGNCQLNRISRPEE